MHPFIGLFNLLPHQASMMEGWHELVSRVKVLFFYYGISMSSALLNSPKEKKKFLVKVYLFLFFILSHLYWRMGRKIKAPSKYGVITDIRIHLRWVQDGEITDDTLCTVYVIQMMVNCGTSRVYLSKGLCDRMKTD